MSCTIFNNYRVLVVIPAVLCTSGPAGALESSVTAKLSLESTRVMLGEPIVLNFSLSNISAEPVQLDLGRKQTGWIEISVQDAVGAEIARAADYRTLYRTIEGMEPAPTRQLAPGVSHDGQFVVSQWFSLPRAGKYTVTARFRVPNYPGMRQERSILAGTESLGLTVVPAEASRLRGIARDLLKRTEAEIQVVRRITLIESLFSMPEEAAYSAWRELALKPTVDMDYWIMDQLKRLGTPAAGSILAEMARTSPLSEKAGLARSALRLMYMNSVPDVRIQLAPFVAAVEGQVPQ